MRRPATSVLFVFIAGLASACTLLHRPAPPAPPPAAVVAAPAIEKIPFRIGVSSATVENLGKAQGCTSGQGAGLIASEGPVEVYRMQCDSGKVFMARCELRQCKAMPR